MDTPKGLYDSYPTADTSEDDGNAAFDSPKTPINRLPPRPTARRTEGNIFIHSPRSERIGSAPAAYGLRPQASLSSVSVTLANLPKDDRSFLVLVENGNVEDVKAYLQDRPRVNVNCRDIHGIGALRRAIRNENFGMINYLVGVPHLYIGDAVLHAIDAGNTEIVTLLLEGLRERDERMEFLPVPDSTDFTSDVTPLMEAAFSDNFEMVKLLIDRGHKLSRPHPPGCMCGRAECNGNDKFVARLENTKRRYNSYKANSSAAYISLSSKDVIKRCFKLTAELEDCSKKEAELTQKYEELAESVRKFAEDLLEQCTTTDEVELILRQRHHGAPKQCFYPRIYLAFECHQKEFIVHENCQQVLHSAWLDDWQDWRGMSGPGKFFRIILKLFFFIFFTPIYLVVPKPPEFIRRFMHPPIHRYIMNTFFYIVFLTFLFIETSHDRDPKYRGAPRSGFEIPIILFVLGQCVEFFKTWRMQGSKRFWAGWWNIYEGFNKVQFSATFCIWLWADIRKSLVPPLDRMSWEWDEPVLLAESLFGFATILSFGRLLQICRIDRYMGPLLISVGKIVFSMGQFFFVYFAVILSFSTGLNHLYEAYDGQVRVNNDGTNTTQSDALTSFSSTVRTLFWALFGRADGEAENVIISNIYENGTVWKNFEYREHYFTQVAGRVIFALYHVIANLVLLNCVIAVLSNTFTKVDENKDKEWKYARTQIWFNYFDEGHLLPAPFNICPSVGSLIEIFRRVMKRDVIDKEQGLLYRHECIRYAELQARLVQAVFAKIEREEANEKLNGVEKNVQKILAQLDLR